MNTKRTLLLARGLLFSCLLLVVSCKNDNPVVPPEKGFEAGPILFISDKSGTSQLYSMNEDGSNVQQLTSDPNFPIFDAKWSLDGSKIAVVSLIGDEMTYPSFRDAIFIMNADGTNRYQLTKQWSYVDDSTWGRMEYGGATSPVWSPDSKRIAFTRLMVPEVYGNTDIFVIALDATIEKRVTKTMNMSEYVTDWGYGENMLLAWIIDWSSTNSSPFTKAVMLDTQGAITKSWGNGALAYQNPIYSSQGDRIALVIVSNPATSPQDSIYVLDLSNANAVNVTKGGYKFYRTVAWSSDSAILVSASSGNVDKIGRSVNRILVLSSEGTSVKDITPFDSVYLQPTSWRRR